MTTKPRRRPKTLRDVANRLGDVEVGNAFMLVCSAMTLIAVKSFMDDKQKSKSKEPPNE
jgi:hypothetical protein